MSIRYVAELRNSIESCFERKVMPFAKNFTYRIIWITCFSFIIWNVNGVLFEIHIMAVYLVFKFSWILLHLSSSGSSKEKLWYLEVFVRSPTQFSLDERKLIIFGPISKKINCVCNLICLQYWSVDPDMQACACQQGTLWKKNS